MAVWTQIVMVSEHTRYKFLDAICCHTISPSANLIFVSLSIHSSINAFIYLSIILISVFSLVIKIESSLS